MAASAGTLRARAARWLEDERSLRDAVDPAARRRRLAVVLVALALGALCLGWTLRLAPGDPAFIPATLVLALIWALGFAASGRPVRLAGRQAGRRWRELAVGLAAGLALLAAFLLGAGLVADLPLLRDPVQSLLAHAHWGSLIPVLAVAALNGVVEELFFRGALYDAAAGRWAPAITTAAYTLVTACAGVALLAFAALVLGAACALLRRATGALIAPIACHLSWSLGLILLLEPTLDWWR